VDVKGKIELRALTAGCIADLERLFAPHAVTNACWCMWFITSVKEFHAAGADGNRGKFCSLMAASDEPMGVLAYLDGDPVGWCAAGPRARYERAVKTPTLKGTEPAAGENVWFIPCFFIHPDARRMGLMRALLAEAVRMAQAHGATAIEGFPLASGRRPTGSDSQVGLEGVFADCRFEEVTRPSPSRVVMRRQL